MPTALFGFKERIARVYNDTLLIVEYPLEAIPAISPRSGEGRLYLSPGESFSDEYQINKNHKVYKGKKLFKYQDSYIFSLEYIRGMLRILDDGSYQKIEQTHWQSNEIEFEIR